ncbi:MAG: DUF962 domain-containing protein [Sphingomonadaceae bacterium]|nr:DUF962 domain-containing protein [Sphingomonadaceae bacterium]
MDPVPNFRAFWLVYLRDHLDPRCRALHYCASVCGLAGLGTALVTRDWRAALIGMVLAYAFAWSGHFFVAHNRPTTFRYPLWSLAADYRMFFRWLTGRLSGDLARAAR